MEMNNQLNLHRPVDISRVKVRGELDQRVKLGLRHLLDNRGRILGGEGHVQGWGDDQVGRWVYAVTQVAQYTGSPIPELEVAIGEFLAVQEDRLWDGYSGWQHWGTSRVTIGLAEYWEHTHDPRVLRSLKKLGEIYLDLYRDVPSEAPLERFFDHIGAIVALLALWRVTEDPKYLEIARWAADHTIETRLLYARDRHVHCDILTGVRGLLELYLVTGGPKYLAESREVYDRILNKDMWVTGGINEGFVTPFETRDEACQVADWLRCSFNLWQITGESKYMDVAERVLFNHLFFDQDHSGAFCSIRSVGVGPATKMGGRDSVAWICCSMHGLRELCESIKYLYTHTGDGIDVNLFTRSEALIFLKEGKVKVIQDNDFLSNLDVLLRVEPENDFRFRLRLRIPAWATAWEIEVNSEPIQPERVDGYAEISRLWKSGDEVRVRFSTDFRIVPEGRNDFSAPALTSQALAEAEELKLAAILYGPLVLMVDPVLNPHEMYTWEGVKILMPRDERGNIFLPRVPRPVAGRAEFSVPGMCFMTLGREVKTPEKVGSNIFEPDRGQSVQMPQVSSQDPPADDETWRVVFLVPISELTGRQTATIHRMVPYEVRNDMRILDREQTSRFLAQVRRRFNTLLKNKWLRTTGYLMQLRR